MTEEEKKFIPIPSQTVGPYFHLAMTPERNLGRMAMESAQGERVHLIVRVLDGEGRCVPDAVIELWQADAAGKYNHPDDPLEKTFDPAFTGFGRVTSDAGGECIFDTVRPGRVAGPAGRLQAPHINIHVFARGILRHVSTRIYFENDPANGEDSILALVPAERRETLMARPDLQHPATWTFDVKLCGDRETVFFDA